MARSPFQGTFQPNLRPTIAQSPDAIVRINGKTMLASCPKCARRFDLNKYVTSIQTNASIDSVPGSATISLSIPRHAVDDFYFDGKPIIALMSEVEIYAKGYYLVEGLPQYYPIFWGVVTELGDSYSSGSHSVSIQCADILHWWQIAQIAVNPAMTAPSGSLGRSLFGNVFTGMNPYDVIFTLAYQSFGDIVVGTGSLKQLMRENADTGTFTNALANVMGYWEQRFARMRSNLVLFGTKGVSIRGETLFAKYSPHQRRLDETGPQDPIIATAVRDAQGTGSAADAAFTFDPYSKDVVAYKTSYPNMGGGLDLVQSEYQTKLEIANVAKDCIGFEFFMDVSGDIVFKPPFFNLDVFDNKPVSWVQDADIISWEFSESDSEVVTMLQMEGSYGGAYDYGVDPLLTPRTTVTDYHLLAQYGWRTHQYNSEFIKDPQSVFMYGLDQLDRINSRRFAGSVTVPMRPELRLGFPVYVAPRDEMWYLTGISHSLSFGGQASTTLTLTAKRSKFVAPRGIGTLRFAPGTPDDGDKKQKNKDGQQDPVKQRAAEIAKSGKFVLDTVNAASMPNLDPKSGGAGADDPGAPLILRHPKTGRILGYPNVVMAYTRPFEPTPQQAKNVTGESKNTDGIRTMPDGNQQNIDAQEEALRRKISANRSDYLQGKYLNNAYQYGLNSAGVYIYAHDVTPGGAVSEALVLPRDNLDVTPDSGPITLNPSQSAFIRPVSDEHGFEVIGHFQYGRHVRLSDGQLITRDPNAKTNLASVTAQSALSGDLSAVLTAQSQGLVPAANGRFPDPGAYLSKMAPEDAQTAATLESGEPKYAPPDAYVGTAPLGSVEEKGFSSAEASQLSRALTLAEMAVLDSNTVPDENCVCMTGRADLAFMNFSNAYGSPLTSLAHEDTSYLDNLPDQPITVGVVPQAAAQLDTYNAQLTQAKSELNATNDRLAKDKQDLADLDNPLDSANPARMQVLARIESDEATAVELTKTISDLESKVPLAELNLTATKAKYSSSSGSIFNLSRSQVINRVDSYLVALYKTLDDAHQQYEKAIRGDLLPGAAADQSGLSADQRSPQSELAPPFFEPNRLTLGDPKAAAASVQTNANNIAAAWSNAAKTMKANAQRSQLTNQVNQDEASIARLTTTLNQLLAQQKASNVVIGIDVQKQLDTLQKQIDKLRQQVNDNQLKLQGLPTSNV